MPIIVEKVEKAVSLNVLDCPRCREIHPMLLFTEFNRHQFNYYTHYAICPTLCQPIMALKSDDYPDGWYVQ